MRLVQQDKKQTASLPVWLSRDIPHERELAREMLQAMGEKSLDYLLHLHDVEETQREKRLRPYYAAVWFCAVGLITTMFVFDWIGLKGIWGVLHGSRLHVPYLLVESLWIWIAALRLLQWMPYLGRRRKPPFFSSPVQQNVVTALLDYGPNPVIADALSRATTYYAGDRTLLFERLAQTLPLLPDTPEALTKPARRALAACLSPLLVVPFAGEKERRPFVQATVKAYLVRTGKPAFRAARFLFGRRYG